MVLKENLEKIREQIGNTRIVGVTKFQSLEKIREAVREGVLDLGVNYAQDGEKLREEFKGEKINWHFIGHVQSRKSKYLSHYDLVQSIDRLEVLKPLTEPISILLEINIGRELTKSGVFEETLEAVLEQTKTYPNVRVRGLMVMPPPLEVEERRPYFKKTFQLYDKFTKTLGFDTLSMGTSDDYLVAVEEGSNMVRLGTALFGPRPPKNV
jgi:pyridoxal phosphate enzyme (YggS family)